MKEEVLSVGIDIGTSTTQLVFSKIGIENTASAFGVPRITIVDKEIIYRSDIHFTPLLSQTEIDSDAVRRIVEKEYQQAHVRPNDVQTGAVIITGETARKQNARDVLQSLSGFAGDFVVATAGPDLESIISAKGAGIDKVSEEKGASVVNLDIGGGTTNLAVFNDGELVNTGCLDIGGRLIKIAPSTRKITYIADKIKQLINERNLQVKEGDIADIEQLRKVAMEMVSLLEQSVNLTQRTPFYSTIVTHHGIDDRIHPQYISFSGGVADYVYHPEADDVLAYGDIGILLGQAIRQSALCEKLKLVQAAETIRATVVGAGTHTTEISGSTITYTEENFPMKNLPILKLTEEDESQGFAHLQNVLQEKLRWFILENEWQPVAIAIRGKKSPSFAEIQELAKALIGGMEALIKADLPLVVIVEMDFAKVLGQTMHRQLQFSKEVICIDSIRLENGDYIDIGKPLANGRVLPVIIKTLVFHS